MSRFAFRQAWRSLLKQRSYLVVSVATLAIAIGALTAVFSVVKSILIEPLPYPDADRIVRVLRVQPPIEQGPIGRQSLAEWQAQSADVFEAMGAFYGLTANITGGGEAAKVEGSRVTPEFWTVMGVKPLLGRTWTAEEEKANERVVVLTHALWQSRYGGDRAFLGKDVVLNGESFRVIGVLPASFTYPSTNGLLVPTFLPASQTPRGNSYLNVLAKLKPGVTQEQATARMVAITAGQAKAFPDEHENLSAMVMGLHTRLSSTIAPMLQMLMLAAGLVLLVACANLAQLSLARAQVRTQELAVRRALGASRFRLGTQLFAESAIVAVVGAGLGIFLAKALVDALPTIAADLLPTYNELAVDGQVLAFTIGAALVALFAFGLGPAWSAAQTQPAASLREDARGGLGGKRRTRVRGALVVAEVALTLLLLSGAALLIESLRRIANEAPGVRTDHVLTATITFADTAPLPGESPMQTYLRQVAAMAPKTRALLDRVAQMPEVESVGMVDALPLSGRSNTNSNITIKGRDAKSEDGSPALAEWRFVSEDYFRTLDLAVTKGRNVARDEGVNTDLPSEILVNQAFVDQYLADVDPIGQMVDVFEGEKRIVGVVASARQWGLERKATPEVYFPIADSFVSSMSIVVHTRVAPEAAAEPLRRVLREIAPDSPVSEVRSMDQVLGQTMQSRRFFAGLMAAFGGVALLLAAIGLYGVIAYGVAQRRREFGVRMSLGAASRDVLALVLKQGIVLVGAGLAIGLAGAFALTRLIEAQLYGVAAHDPLVLLVVCGVLLFVALAACWLPARRAAATSPVEALRYQ